MGQGVVGVHLHRSVARQRHVEISRHCVSTWDWAVGNPKNYSTEPSTEWNRRDLSSGCKC